MNLAYREGSDLYSKYKPNLQQEQRKSTLSSACCMPFMWTGVPGSLVGLSDLQLFFNIKETKKIIQFLLGVLRCWNELQAYQHCSWIVGKDLALIWWGKISWRLMQELWRKSATLSGKDIEIMSAFSDIQSHTGPKYHGQ